MTRLRRWAVLITALGVVASGCGPGGGEGEGEVQAEAQAAGFTDDEIRSIAQQWIDEQSGLTQMLREELFFDAIQRLGKVAHVRYLQAHGGVAVRGANFIVHVLSDGTVQGASNSLTTSLPAADATEQLSREQAIQIATGAVTGQVEGQPRVESTWIQSGGVLRLGWQVLLTTVEPRESWSVVVDAANGTVLSVETLTASAAATPSGAGALWQAGTSCQPAQLPAACIFVPDPIGSSGQSIDLGAADTQLVPVPLSLPVGGSSLSNGWVSIDTSRPEYAQADGVWGEQGSGTPDFAAGSAYYWITYTQQKMASLGFPIHGDDVVDVFPVDEDSPNNAFYDPVNDEIRLGIDDNDILAASDASVMIHEYGHAVIQAAIPGISFAPDGGAFNEGGSDVLGLLMTLEFRRHDPGCLTSWYIAGGRGCGRRLDTDKVYPDDLVAEVHDDGEIYTGAVWDVLVGMLQQQGLTVEQCSDAGNPCGATRDRLLATYLGSLGYLTSNMTLHDAAAAFRLADASQFDGAMAPLIDASFGAHGLSTQKAPSTGNDGDTGRPIPPSVTIDVGHERLGDLRFDVLVLDAAGQELCRETVQTPDPESMGTELFGTFPLGSIGDPCVEHLPPSPERRWGLGVVDTVAGSVGTIVRFEVHDGANPHPAFGLPLPIPDNDPAGAQAIIGG